MWKYVQMQQRFRTSAYELLAVIQRQFLSLLSVVKYLRNLFLQSADRMATESTHFQVSYAMTMSIFVKMISTPIETA